MAVDHSTAAAPRGAPPIAFALGRLTTLAAVRLPNPFEPGTQDHRRFARGMLAGKAEIERHTTARARPAAKAEPSWFGLAPLGRPRASLAAACHLPAPTRRTT
jgi:hypothetical protein